jgi:hypothetical protein
MEDIKKKGITIVSRHADRWTYRPNAPKHDRIKENPLDEPLSEKGHNDSKRAGEIIADILVKIPGLSINSLNVYSSPLDRCVSTSIHYIDAIREKTGIFLPIRVDYKLTETISPMKVYDFNDKNKVMRIKSSKKPAIQNLPFISPLDEKLRFENIILRYPGHIDQSYKTRPKKNHLASREDTMRLAISWFKTLNPQENKMVVCHLDQFFGLYGYLKKDKVLERYEMDLFENDKGTNAFFVHDGNSIIYLGKLDDFHNCI